MTGLASFLWSLFDLNGTASCKRGWIVFAVALVVIVAEQVVGLLASFNIEVVPMPMVVVTLAMTPIPVLALLVTVAILCPRPNRTNTLPNGRSHNVLDAEEGRFPDNEDGGAVPSGVLSDLSYKGENSMENVKGRCRTSLFSSAGAALLDISAWRPGRYWKAVE